MKFEKAHTVHVCIVSMVYICIISKSRANNACLLSVGAGDMNGTVMPPHVVQPGHLRPPQSGHIVSPTVPSLTSGLPSTEGPPPHTQVLYTHIYMCACKAGHPCSNALFVRVTSLYECVMEPLFRIFYPYIE